MSKHIDWAELGEISKVEMAPKYLSERTIKLAEESGIWDRLLGRDEKIARLLHLSVRTTRYACRRWGGHGEYSREAYRLLHTKYKQTEWAEKTPYWFEKVWKN